MPAAALKDFGNDETALPDAQKERLRQKHREILLIKYCFHVKKPFYYECSIYVLENLLF